MVIVFKSSTYFTDSLIRGRNGFITEKTILFQGSRGGPTFSRGGGGGVQMLISIETLITCAFPGEGCSEMFVCFDSLHPINNLSDIKGRVFLG